MTSNALRALIVLVVVTLFVTVSADAQTARATIRGVVLDQTGARLPGAQIVVTRDDTNESREVTSDEEGRFAVAELAAGRYTIEARLTGFSIYRNRAHLTVGQELWLEPQLTVAATASVTTGGSDSRIPLLEKNSPAMTTLIDQDQVSNLPLDGRNFLELALLSPGTVPAPQGSASSVRGDFAFITNGAREDFNNYILDGVYNVDPKLNTPAVRPPADGIQEFEVATSTYDASFGRNAAGQVNVLSRSGSNRFSGTGYEFLRNGALDSRNHFAPDDVEDPEYSRHQFGGSIGGPIARNRAFFFADYEHTRLREGITRVTNVPTALERSGDFSQSLFPRPVDPFTQQLLPGGVIPPFFQHPTGAAIARLYPDPNRNQPFANFVSSPTLEDDVHQFDGKIEYSLSPRARFTSRYSFSERDLLEPFAGTGFSTVPGFGNLVDRRGQNLGITFTAASPRYVNDARFGYTRVSIGVFPENPTTSNASIGLPSLATNPRDLGLSLISIAGYSPLGHEYNNPQESTSDSFQLSDTATVVWGSHLVKLGGEWYGVRQSAYRDVQARGFLTFLSQGFTNNALADVLLGLPSLTGGARLDNPQNLRAHSWSLFAHDDWRATRKLTVSAGLRYDYASPPVDKDDRANLYDFATGSVVPVGTDSMPRGGFEPDRNNIAPRVGFAWTLDDLSQWVVRGGYGIYYNQGALATSEGLFFNPPYFNLGVAFSGPGLPLLTLSNPFPTDFPVFIPQSATAYQRDLQAPWMEHWNVNVQRQIGVSRAIEFAYVGSRGHDLISARDGNQPVASPIQPNLRPNPLFADITLIESRASSRYNAAPAQIRAAAGVRPLHDRRLHLREIDRRCVGVLHERGRRQLPAEQPRSGRGAQPIELRRPPQVLNRSDLRPAVLGQRVGEGLAGAGGRQREQRPSLHGRRASRHRRQQHRAIESRIRLQRSPERQRRSQSLSGRPDGGTLVQHRRVLDAAVRHVRKLRPQYGRRPGFQEPQPRHRETGPARRRTAAAAFRDLQPVQHDELRSAGRVPGIADLRPDSLGRIAAAHSAWREGALLNIVKAR